MQGLTFMQLGEDVPHSSSMLSLGLLLACMASAAATSLNWVHVPWCSFQKSFSGVDVLPGFADSSALVQIQNAANLAIVDSVISNIPGSLEIKNSTIQVLRSSFTLCSGDTAGAMTIDSSQVNPIHPLS